MKFKIALFFLILFTGVILAPTVISLVIDKDQGISISLSLSEDEEKGLETKSLSKTIISTHSYSYIFFKKIQKVKNVRFTSKKYTVFSPKTITPPPELIS
ncbi:MAG: hypothetical protein NWQ31_12625 [Polaribacter sp.]|nr:hypothetical protein [Polaribacter sp.]